jgi:hypothetical protein
MNGYKEVINSPPTDNKIVKRLVISTKANAITIRKKKRSNA